MSDGHHTSGAVRLRQRLTAATSSPPAEDLLEWAEICVNAGLPRYGRSLYESVFIREGFSPQLVKRWRGICSTAELWDDSSDPRSQTALRGSVEIGLKEIEALAFSLPASFLQHAVSSTTDEAAPDVHQHAVRPRETLDEGADLDTFADALGAFLGGPPPEDWSAADRLLARIAASADQTGVVDRRALLGADLPTMAAAQTVANLIEFTDASRHLFEPPTGSAKLLWHAARFDSAGLGPYFGNIGRLARKSRDVFELAQAAARAAGTGPAFWLFLLSDRLPRALLFEVVDDLGDQGDMATLCLICRRSTARRLLTDTHLLQRIRDAALDSHDYDLAIRAQSAIADTSSRPADDFETLGAIYGTAGYTAAAEDAYAASLNRDPARASVLAQLAALRQHAFSPYHVMAGYDTPEDRRFTRARRRSGVATRSTSEASNPIAVELGNHPPVTTAS